MKGYIQHLDGTEIEVELDGYVSKYHPATMYKNNGDPGDPEEGGELEDFTVKLDGIDITDEITEEDYERLSLDFWENWEEEDYGD
jgi:hypothetical protein